MKNSLLHSLTFFLSLILLLVFVSSETVCGQPENTEIKEPDNLVRPFGMSDGCRIRA